MFWLIAKLINLHISIHNRKHIARKERKPFIWRAAIKKYSNDQNGILRAVFNEKINLRNLEKTRENLLKNEHFKCGFFALIVKELGKTLVDNPIINSHSTSKKIIYFNTSNISFVVSPNDISHSDCPRTIFNVEKKSIKEIDSEIKHLVKDVRENKLNAKENLKAGGIALSNFGQFGVGFGVTPPTPPFSASIGIGAKDQNGDAIFSVSFDHRWFGGQVVAKFLSDLKRNIENLV